MLFFFPHFKSIILLPLVYIIPMKSEVILLLLYLFDFFPLPCLRFSLYLCFLIINCNESWFFPPCILFLSWIYRFIIFIKIWKFLAFISFKYIFYSVHQLFFLDSDDMYLLDHLIFSLRFFLVIFLSVFLFYVLKFWVASFIAFSTLLNFFVVSNCYKSCLVKFLFHMLYFSSPFHLVLVYIFYSYPCYIILSFKFLSTLSMFNVLVWQFYFPCRDWICLYWFIGWLISLLFIGLIFLLPCISSSDCFRWKKFFYPNYYLEKMFKLILKRIVISTHLPQLFDIT